MEMKNEYRARQLMQVWRDYYDEILEINYEKGTYISLAGADEASALKGFVDLDLMLLLKKRIYPDDAEAFKRFMDKDVMLEARKKGQKISKLNFRYKTEYDNYVWVKVKNIIPEYQGEDEFICFSCFRRVDIETNEELRKKQELTDALNAALEVSAAKGELLEELSREFRSPLQGIIGMSSIARMSVRNVAKTTERLEKIENAAKTMATQLDMIIEKDRSGFAKELEEEESEDVKVDTLYDESWKIEDKEARSSGQGESYDEWSVKQREAMEDDMAEDSSDDEEYDFSDRRVLIVEDNQLNLETMKEILEMTGFETDTATGGKEAIISFIKNPVGYYDVILMDMELPDMDGVEATRCIRISGKDDSATVPVFAVYAKTATEDPRVKAENGFNDKIQKPIDFKILYKKMKNAIDSKVEYVVSEEL